MLILWVSGGVFLLALVAMAVIVVRKFPMAAAVDPEQAPPAEIKKAEIVETRLRRKFTTAWVTVREKSRPAVQLIGKGMVRAQAKLRDLEHEYKVRSIPVLLNRRQRHRLNDEIQVLLDQSEALVVDGELKAAEEKCLQAIRIEPRSLPSFDVLGDIYMKQKEYAHAKEVYRFLEKLIDEVDAVFDHHGDEANATAKNQRDDMRVKYLERLALSYQGLDDLPAAFETIQSAYRQAPANPRIIDLYLDIAIADGKKSFALSALEQLRTTNPENSKIPEWAEKIDAMPESHLSSLPVDEPIA